MTYNNNLDKDRHFKREAFFLRILIFNFLCIFCIFLIPLQFYSFFCFYNIYLVLRSFLKTISFMKKFPQ